MNNSSVYHAIVPDSVPDSAPAPAPAKWYSTITNRDGVKINVSTLPFIPRTAIFCNTQPNENNNSEGLELATQLATQHEQQRIKLHTVEIHGNFSHETVRKMYSTLKDVPDVKIYTRTEPNDVGFLVARKM